MYRIKLCNNCTHSLLAFLCTVAATLTARPGGENVRIKQPNFIQLSTVFCPPSSCRGNMCLIFLPLLLFLLAFYSPPSLFPSVDGSWSCPHQCVCYEHGDLVDCRSRGFEHVPRGLPHGAWLLELGGNNLSLIGTRAFTGLWSLRVLVLANSQIQDIQPQVGMMGWRKVKE